jgi:hypothetical protein
LLSSPSTIARRTTTPSRFPSGRRRIRSLHADDGGDENLKAAAAAASNCLLRLFQARCDVDIEEPRLSVKIKSTLDQARPRLTPTTTTTAHVSTLGVDKRK